MIQQSQYIQQVIQGKDVIWQPQQPLTDTGLPKGLHPQQRFLKCPVYDVLYGGARGGGKTDALLAYLLARIRRYGDDINAVFFRRSFTPELEQVIRRSQEIYPRVGGKWHGRGLWTFGRASVRLRHLEREDDAIRYQGHSYTDVIMDEMTTFSSDAPLRMLEATLRSASGIPVRVRGAANPGGVGHQWVKMRYIDPAPQGWKVIVAPADPDDADGPTVERCFIPATLDDNVILQEQDPRYWTRVIAATAGNRDLQRAWRFGIWDIAAGGYFTDVWDLPTHVVEPFSIPRDWIVKCSFDWGSARPYSVGWWARTGRGPATLKNGTQRYFPPGSWVRIHELYGWTGRPNEGTRETPRQIAARIRAEESGMPWGGQVRERTADPAIFSKDRGGASNSIAEDMRSEGISFLPAARFADSRVNGWNIIRGLMQEAKNDPPENPGMWVFNTCTQFIRTVPVLPRSKRNPDDLDTDGEDHIADEMRYGIVAPPTAKPSRLAGI